LPKRGFTNIFAKEYATVNVSELDVFAVGAVVDEALLRQSGLIKKAKDGVKILGDGELSKSLTVKATMFSSGAKQKIEAAGGKAEVV
jgi:large subunit ribosomal protein L15